MKSGQALKQHLHVLQSGRPLDAPWHDVPVGAAGMLQKPPEDLFVGVEGAEVKRLQEVVRTAEFWIALLEGERSDLAEEIAKHKQRHQLAVRQAETQSKSLREAENEKRRLEKEVKWLQQSREEVSKERAQLKEDKRQQQNQTQQKEQSLSDLEAKVHGLDESLELERKEKAYLEENFVKNKIKLVDTLRKADNMEVLIKYYEDQLKALNPSFEPIDVDAVSQWMPRARGDDENSEDSANSATESRQCEEEREKGGKNTADKALHGIKQAASKVQSLGIAKASKVREFFKKDKKGKEKTEQSATAQNSVPSPVPSPRSANSDSDGGTSPVPRWMMRADSATSH